MPAAWLMTPQPDCCTSPIPSTLAQDGDPLDVLIVVDEPTFPGCHILCRPVGVLWMLDEHGPDAKIIALVANDLRTSSIHSIEDLPAGLTDEIAHFFDVYKDLEPAKHTEVRGFEGVKEAWEEIRRSSERASSQATP